MLCAKCQRNEATIHFVTVMDGRESAPIDLCTTCAPNLGFNPETIDPAALEALSVVGKTCEFCGASADSGLRSTAGEVTWWCAACGGEFDAILGELMKEMDLVEHPAFAPQGSDPAAFLAICSDPAIAARMEEVGEKAIEKLRERKRRGDAGSAQAQPEL